MQKHTDLHREKITAEIISQVLLGLDKLHVQNMSHLTLSPEQVLVSDARATANDLEIRIGGFAHSTLFDPTTLILNNVFSRNLAAPEIFKHNLGAH